MIKLLTLLERENDIVKFKTNKTSEDPDTGKITWDVEYFTDFNEIVLKLNELVEDLHKAKQITKIDDPIILKVIDNIRSAKTSLVRRLHQKYPDLLNPANE